MTHILPKMQFIREHFITLNEGFDRVGRVTFPEEWTGLEILAWRKIEPERLLAERKSLEASFRRNCQIASDLRSTSDYGLEEIEFQELRKKRKSAEAAMRSAREELDQFGSTFDTRNYDARMFERRRTVESCLCELIRSEVLELRLSSGTGIDMEGLFKSDGFHLSFAFSQFFTPDSYGPHRRHIAYLDKSNFEAWIFPQEAKLRKYDNSPIEEKMLVWFRHYRADCIRNAKKVTQTEARSACETHFERHDLGKKFEAVWKLLAIDEVKRTGRPPNKR